MHLSEDEITDKVNFKWQTVKKKKYVYKFSNSYVYFSSPGCCFHKELETLKYMYFFNYFFSVIH